MEFIDMSLPPDEFLLEVINEKYNKNFSFDTVYFGSEGVIETDKYGCDSYIWIHAYPGGPFTGSIRAYYNRVNFDEYLEGKQLALSWKAFHDTDDMLPEVLKQLGINLGRFDIISDIVDQTKASMNIRISKKCLAYKGNIEVVFLGHPSTLTGSVNNRVLEGFYLN